MDLAECCAIQQQNLEVELHYSEYKPAFHSAKDLLSTEILVEAVMHSRTCSRSMHSRVEELQQYCFVPRILNTVIVYQGRAPQTVLQAREDMVEDSNCAPEVKARENLAIGRQ